MHLKRVIPCLDVADGRVVKGVEFLDIRDAGDPVELAAHYDREGADELVFLDITATHERRETIVSLARRTADEVFVPFTIGGGIRSVADAQAVLDAGANKVSVNSAALARPELIDELARVFGAQCVVLAIDAKARARAVGETGPTDPSQRPVRASGESGPAGPAPLARAGVEPGVSTISQTAPFARAHVRTGANGTRKNTYDPPAGAEDPAVVPVPTAPGGWEAYVAGGRTPTGRDVIAWAREATERGAGEILLTSMDRDGTSDGYDLELTAAVSEAVGVPVIASGGAGELEHLAQALQAGADAALCASIFHYGHHTVAQAKAHLAAAGIAVRR